MSQTEPTPENPSVDGKAMNTSPAPTEAMIETPSPNGPIVNYRKTYSLSNAIKMMLFENHSKDKARSKGVFTVGTGAVIPGLYSIFLPKALFNILARELHQEDFNLGEAKNLLPDEDNDKVLFIHIDEHTVVQVLELGCAGRSHPRSISIDGSLTESLYYMLHNSVALKSSIDRENNYLRTKLTSIYHSHESEVTELKKTIESLNNTISGLNKEFSRLSGEYASYIKKVKSEKRRSGKNN